MEDSNENPVSIMQEVDRSKENALLKEQLENTFTLVQQLLRETTTARKSSCQLEKQQLENTLALVQQLLREQPQLENQVANQKINEKNLKSSEATF